MKIDITSLDGSSAGSIELDDEIFGLEPRADLIARMVRYQLAKRRAGSHAVKNRADIWRTGKKMYKQKGTGGARHGSARVPQFVAAAASSDRSCAAMPMTCRRKCARSRSVMRCRRRPGMAASSSGPMPSCRSEDQTLQSRFAKLGLNSALIVDGAAPQANFCLAARNIPEIDVLPVQGINVYDILRREKLVLTRAAIDALEARFK